MNRFSKFRWVLAFLTFAYFPVDAQVIGDLKVAFIRVSFPEGDYLGFTGNGNFEYNQKNICGDYTIDPAPHDKNYFQSHVEAVNNYFRSVSYGKFGLDILNSVVLPNKNQNSYVIQKPANYYNELSKEEDHEKRITELLRDGIQAAFDKDNIDFSHYDLVAIIHPGVGQDFKLPFLDPTPEDIPSTFVDKHMVNTHLGGPILIGNASIPSGIILPESQNHILMDSVIRDALNNPCNIQFSITGTWALMVGFAVGLPPLWDLDTGLSGVGLFSLMDQGSNNGHGIVPAPPDAWTRIYAGWESPTKINYNDLVNIKSGESNQIVRIDISRDEYFLIENRNNWFRDGVSIDSSRYVVWEKTKNYPSFINILLDSVGVNKNQYGVITSISNYDLGMPASGLLIWHIDEKKIREGINSFSVNGDRKHRGIDLEEADGAQDIGYVTNLLTDPSSGYWGDMWFVENNEYFRANAEGSMDFSSFTYPNTKSNFGVNSGININNISKVGKTMSFTLLSSYNMTFIKDENKTILSQWDVDRDGDLDFIGEGDSLWWGDDLNDVNAFYKNVGENIQACIVQNSNSTGLVIVSNIKNKVFFKWFEFDPDLKNFVLTWENKNTFIGPTRLLKADEQHKRIWVIDDYSQSIVTVDSIINLYLAHDDFPYIDNNHRRSYFLDPMGLNVTTGTVSDNIIHEGDFKYLSLIDLENDGHAEIILTDKRGSIHALDSKFIYKNGFPIEAKAVGPILGLDIMEDDNPELVYQSDDGSIRILNNEGVEIDRISNGAKLKGLGAYDGSHAILTEKNIIKYKKKYMTNGNKWNYNFGTPDFSRILMMDKTVTYNSYLMDADLTYGYPNPSYGENIIFRIQAGQVERIEINIFDLAGFPVHEIIRDFQLNSSSSAKHTFNGVVEIPWDLTNIDSGIYLAKVIVNGDGKLEEKTIKVGVIK